MQVVTISDIAKASGVSMATVSRVINNNSLVTEPKRRRVSQVMQELGYVPVNRANKNSPDRQIIPVVSPVMFPMLEDTYRGIFNAVKDLGPNYEPVVSYTGDRKYDDALSLIRMFPPEMIRGLIFFNNQCKDTKLWEEFQRYPLVQIGEYNDTSSHFVVTVDDTLAMSDITRLLIGKGRRRFVFVSNNFSSEDRRYNFCIRREAGFLSALREADIFFDKNSVIDSDYTIEGGVDAARTILEMKSLPDAVVCVSDFMAAGCVMELREKGIQVPDDIAVTGFDDCEISEFCRPKLTTVRQPFEEMGMEAVRMLNAICTGSVNLGRRIFIPHSIVERGSA